MRHPHGLRASLASGGGIEYIGAVTKTTTNGASDWDTSGEAPNVLGTASVGDLVVVAFSFGNRSDTTWSWNGMSFTAIVDDTGTTNPGLYVGYRFVQSGDTNPYITNASGNFGGLCAVFSVFRNVSSYVSYASASNTTGYPDSPSLTANGNLWLSIGHQDGQAISTWTTIPTNYTLSSNSSGTTLGLSSTVIAYRIATLSSDNPSAFAAASGSDAWKAETVAFS